MKIIVNSDILFSTKPGCRALPQHVHDFFSRLKGLGVTVILPRPALLELQRHYQTSELKLLGELDNAIQLLGRYGVPVPDVDTKSLARSPTIEELIRATGVACQVVDPTIEDYRDAERRACLRLPPHPPEIKSDEMRDLVIWSVALRLAKEDGRAILLSRDEVHSHGRGSEESSNAGLIRAKDFQETLSMLGEESPAVERARLSLAVVWDAFRVSGLPLPEAPTHHVITSASFVVGLQGEVISRIAIAGDRFSAEVLIDQAAPGKVRGRATNIMVEGVVRVPSELEVVVDGRLGEHASFSSDLKQLKQLIEGQT